MLTVHPQKIGDYPGDEPLPIHLYANESDRFGVPREFFFSNRRATHNIDLQVTEGSKDWWPAEFVGLLRTEQKTALNEVVAMFRAGRMGGIIQAKPGWGKCLGIGTPVLMFDGAIKPVEDIQDGDLLMGPDSRPRRVLSTTRGTGPLYEIVPLRGESWVCNDAHILTLVHSLTGEVQDIEVGEYLKLSKTERHYLKQFAPEQGVDFLSAEPLLLDPYFLGVWFGDGTKGADEGVLRKVAVTKRDEEIKKLCEDVASRYGLHVRVETSGGTRCPTYHLTTGRMRSLVSISPRPGRIEGHCSRVFWTRTATSITVISTSCRSGALMRRPSCSSPDLLGFGRGCRRKLYTGRSTGAWVCPAISLHFPCVCPERRPLPGDRKRCLLGQGSMFVLRGPGRMRGLRWTGTGGSSSEISP